MRKLRILIYCLCIMTLTVFMSSNADAATLKTITVSNSSTYKWDLTHDGKADTVKFLLTKNNYGCVIKAQIYVNGKIAYTYSNSSKYFHRLEVQYVKIANDREFLYVVGRGDSWKPYIQKIFRYDTSSKRLVVAADLSKYTGAVRGITKINGNNLIISYQIHTGSGGRVNWQYEYKYNASSKKFTVKDAKVTAKTASTWYVGDGYDYYFKKSMYKTAQNITTYSNRSCTNKAVVVPSGKWMTLKSIYVTPNGKISLQFKYGNRYVWVKCWEMHSWGLGLGNPYYFCGVIRRLVGGTYG